MSENLSMSLCQRFRGFYPVVIDVETAGFEADRHALLEIAAITLKMDEQGWLVADQSLHFHVKPFEGSVLEANALAFNGIDPYHPLRLAVSEYQAIHALFKLVRNGMKEQHCQRAIIVAHNAHFDHSFVMAAAQRAGLKRNPFHPFATFDTASLAALTLGQTVLAKACAAAGIAFDSQYAHSALYDTEQTSLLFCHMVNQWKQLGGWPLASTSSTNNHNDNENNANSSANHANDNSNDSSTVT